MEKAIQIDRKVIDSIVDNYQASREALLMILQDISEVYNYVPPEAVPILVERLGVKKSLIYSVATFYKTLSLEPRGKHVVHVCTGTACHVRGAGRILEAIEETLNIKEGQTTADFAFTLEAVRCIGCCASGPVVTVNKETYGGLDRSGVVRILDEYKKAASS